jgi:hypothetical protein
MDVRRRVKGEVLLAGNHCILGREEVHEVEARF